MLIFNLTDWLDRTKWQIAHILQFYRNNTPLKTSPYVHYFYIEPKLALPKESRIETQKQCRSNYTTLNDQNDKAEDETREGETDGHQEKCDIREKTKSNMKRSEKGEPGNTDETQNFELPLNSNKVSLVEEGASLLSTNLKSNWTFISINTFFPN